MIFDVIATFVSKVAERLAEGATDRLKGPSDRVLLGRKLFRLHVALTNSYEAYLKFQISDHPQAAEHWERECFTLIDRIESIDLSIQIYEPELSSRLGALWSSEIEYGDFGIAMRDKTGRISGQFETAIDELTLVIKRHFSLDEVLSFERLAKNKEK